MGETKHAEEGIHNSLCLLRRFGAFGILAIFGYLVLFDCKCLCFSICDVGIEYAQRVDLDKLHIDQSWLQQRKMIKGSKRMRMRRLRDRVEMRRREVWEINTDR
jgi:hypothetical protein